MNTLLILTFCGLAASVFAGPSCSDDEASKCDALAPHDVKYELFKTWPKNAEELNHLCPGFLKMMQCVMDFSDRCPNTMTAFLIDSNRELQRVYSKICEESDPERQQFLENVGCLNAVVGTVTKDCEAAITDLPYCELMAAIGKCIKDDVAKKCGADAHHIFSDLFRPKELIYEAFCRGNPEETM